MFYNRFPDTQAINAMRITPLLNILVLFVAAYLVGCSSTPDDDPTYNMSVAELYQEAKAKLKNGEYETAIQYYEKLESRFPYGPYAERARLEVAYAYYKDLQPETAIVSADRFIKLHPKHSYVDYAYYLRGLASYDSSVSYFEELFKQDPAERDPKAARQAFNYFSELIRKFPKSRYTSDAVQRMKEIRENLSRYEVYVAEYYQRKGAHLAAANRAKYVIENYQGTRSIPDALALMVSSYRKLGMQKLAKDAFKVLELNHPDHEKTRAIKSPSKKSAAEEPKPENKKTAE